MNARVICSATSVLCGKEKKKSLEGCPIMHFLVDCESKDAQKLDQVLKSSFFCHRLEWMRVGSNDETMSMVDLVYWVCFM